MSRDPGFARGLAGSQVKRTGSTSCRVVVGHGNAVGYRPAGDRGRICGSHHHSRVGVCAGGRAIVDTQCQLLRSGALHRNRQVRVGVRPRLSSRQCRVDHRQGCVRREVKQICARLGTRVFIVYEGACVDLGIQLGVESTNWLPVFDPQPGIVAGAALHFQRLQTGRTHLQWL